MKQKIFIYASVIILIASTVFYFRGLNILKELRTVHPAIVSDPNDYIDYGSEIQNPYTDRHYDGFKWAQQNSMTSCDQGTLDLVNSGSFSEGCQKYIELKSSVKPHRSSNP